ncbi:MAG: hypothetical protein EVA32_00740 [Chloroflexi bacterium]|nr:MAG: hypothetical protein EVA32_00740 [Chloroflexota bacterium]
MIKNLFFLDKFYLTGFILLIPTSINLSITQFLSPVLNAIMGRTERPELSISAFSIAFSILFLIALPNLRIQQLTIVYYKNFNKYKIHFFVVLLSIICLFISVIIIFTPISSFFLGNIFGTKGDLRDSVEKGLRLGFYIPVLLILKMHLYGISIVSYRSSLIWIGTIFGFLSACLLAVFFFILNYEGYQIGMLSFSISLFLETLLIFFLVRKYLIDTDHKLDRNIFFVGDLFKFFTPLLFAAFLPAFTLPAVNACLTRLENPEISISAVNVGFGIFGAVSFTINGCQSTILSLISNGYKFARIREFSYFVGFITLIICSIIAWVNPINEFIFVDLFNLQGNLYKSTLLVFRLLSFLPPFLVMEQLYVGIIMNSKSTNPIIYINLCRFLVLIMTLGTGILVFKNFESYGAIVGGSAWSLTLFFEAIFAWLFARKIAKP